MRHGLWWAPLVLVCGLGGCGISKDRYRAQVARANKLELHLKRNLDRVDYLETREKAAQRLMETARAKDLARVTRLTQQVARVNAALHRKEKTLSSCLATRARPPARLAGSHTIHAPLRRRPGELTVTLALGSRLLVQLSGPPTGARLATRQLRRTLLGALPEITLCAAQALLKRRPSLRVQFAVTLVIDRRGRVRSVKVLHQPRTARPVGKCVIRGLRKLRLAAVSAPLFAVVPLRLDSNPILIQRGIIPLVLNDVTIRQVLRDHRNAIQYCFISSGLPAKKLRLERVKVAFMIGLDGHPGPVRVVSSVLGHAATNACLLRTVKRICFPKPSGRPRLVQPEFRWRNPPRKRR